MDNVDPPADLLLVDTPDDSLLSSQNWPFQCIIQPEPPFILVGRNDDDHDDGSAEYLFALAVLMYMDHKTLRIFFPLNQTE